MLACQELVHPEDKSSENKDGYEGILEKIELGMKLSGTRWEDSEQDEIGATKMVQAYEHKMYVCLSEKV